MLSFRVDRIGLADPSSGKRRTAAFKRAIGRQAARARNGGRRLFSAAGK
jgi:hypothetical protein